MLVAVESRFATGLRCGNARHAGGEPIDQSHPAIFVKKHQAGRQGHECYREYFQSNLALIAPLKAMQ